MSENNLTVRDQSTAVATGGGRELNVFEKAAAARTGSRIVGRLLKFNKYGDWVIDNTVVNGEKFVAAVDGMVRGWQKWWDNKPVGQEMGLIAEGYFPVPRATLGEQDESQWELDPNGKPKDPWRLTYMVILKDPDSEDLFTYSTSSKGGIDTLLDLCETYGKIGVRRHPKDFPIVELKSGGYDHKEKSVGYVKTPNLVVVGWAPKFSDAADAEQESNHEVDQEIPF